MTPSSGGSPGSPRRGGVAFAFRQFSTLKPSLRHLAPRILSKAFTRFRIPWNWDGRTAILQSRATDEAGNVQPTREAFIAERGPPRGTPNVAAFTMEHCNAITSWGINDKGEVSHVYA